MNKQYIQLILALLVLFILLGSFALYLYWPIATGAEATLATLPVDPFDPLRGQYLTIRYEVGTVPSLEKAQAGDSIFVLLQDDAEGIARFKSVTATKPDSGLFLKGTVDSNNGDKMHLIYGIEQYFFERNAHVPGGPLQVKVKIGSNGQARIIGLMQNGKPLTIQYQNASLKS